MVYLQTCIFASYYIILNKKLELVAIEEALIQHVIKMVLLFS